MGPDKKTGHADDKCRIKKNRNYVHRKAKMQGSKNGTRVVMTAITKGIGKLAKQNSNQDIKMAASEHFLSIQKLL
jgi:hypothetical protein